MAKAIFVSLRDGLENVSLTKLEVEMLEKSLTESGSDVDPLLADKKIIIEIIDLNLANGFFNEVEKFGVNCVLTP